MVSKKKHQSLEIPKKAEEIDLSECQGFEVVNEPLKTLVAVDEKEYGKYDKWIKLTHCSVKFKNKPKIPISKKDPEKDPHLHEARIFCKINDMSIKDKPDNPSEEGFYKDDFSLKFLEHEGSSNCHAFLNFLSPDGTSEKKHYNPEDLQIRLPKKANPKDKTDTNVDTFKELTTKTTLSKSK
jgi:hypothetical protein